MSEPKGASGEGELGSPEPIAGGAGPSQGPGLIIVHVNVHVKSEAIEAFRAASIDNARESIREPGVARFDVIQSVEDPTRFVLVEVYRTPDAPAAHKETAHYQRWRDAVASMMAEPRVGIRYAPVFPLPLPLPP